MDPDDVGAEVRSCSIAGAPTSTWKTSIAPRSRRFAARDWLSRPERARSLDAPCGPASILRCCWVQVRRAREPISRRGNAAGEQREASPTSPTENGRSPWSGCPSPPSSIGAFECPIENVFPEDWPLVLGNLRRALRPGGYLYLTVETIDEREIADVYAEAIAAGLPVVYGEHMRRGGGYHHYPSLARVDGRSRSRFACARRRPQRRRRLRLLPRADPVESGSPRTTREPLA